MWRQNSKKNKVINMIRGRTFRLSIRKSIGDHKWSEEWVVDLDDPNTYDTQLENIVKALIARAGKEEI